MTIQIRKKKPNLSSQDIQKQQVGCSLLIPDVGHDRVKALRLSSGMPTYIVVVFTVKHTPTMAVSAAEPINPLLPPLITTVMTTINSTRITIILLTSSSKHC